MQVSRKSLSQLPRRSNPTAVESCIAIKGSSENASSPERDLSYDRPAPVQTAGVFPASCGGATSDESVFLDGAEVIDGLRAVDAAVYENEKWGGGRPNGAATMSLGSKWILRSPRAPSLRSARSTEYQHP